MGPPRGYGRAPGLRDGGGQYQRGSLRGSLLIALQSEGSGVAGSGGTLGMSGPVLPESTAAIARREAPAVNA